MSGTWGAGSSARGWCPQLQDWVRASREGVQKKGSRAEPWALKFSHPTKKICTCRSNWEQAFIEVGEELGCGVTEAREESDWTASAGHARWELRFPLMEIVAFLYFRSFKGYNVTFHPSINSICSDIFYLFHMSLKVEIWSPKEPWVGYPSSKAYIYQLANLPSKDFFFRLKFTWFNLPE